MEASEVDSSLQSVEAPPGEMRVTYSKRTYLKEETMITWLNVFDYLAHSSPNRCGKVLEGCVAGEPPSGAPAEVLHSQAVRF